MFSGTDYFHTLNPSISDFQVQFSGYGTNEFGLDEDVIVVEYQETYWTLNWSPKYSYYSGKIAGIEGYVL